MTDQENKSYFYQFIWGDDGWLSKERSNRSQNELYKKVDYKVVLDGRLTTNDVAVYLSILKAISYTEGYKTKISSQYIKDSCGIVRQSQTKSLQRLNDAGYLEVTAGRYENAFTLKNLNPKHFLPIKLSQFDGLKNNKKEYVRRLRGIILSNGNNKIPSYKVCLKNIGKLTIKEYRKIKSAYQIDNNSQLHEELDVHQYLSLEKPFEAS